MRILTMASLAAAALLILPAFTFSADAASVQPGSVRLSATTLHPGGTLTARATIDASGNVTDLSFHFVLNNSTYAVDVNGNVSAEGNGTYAASHTFNGSEPFGHYTLGSILVCDTDTGCSQDGNVTTPNGTIASFDLVGNATTGQPDLVADAVTAPGSVSLGDTVPLFGYYANRGDATATNFTTVLLVDNVVVGGRSGESLLPGQTASINATWQATTPGPHFVELIVDCGDRVAESNEANNKASLVLFVNATYADLGVRILDITHEPLRTDVATLPNPLPRHILHLEVTNDGDAATLTHVNLTAHAETRIIPIPTSGSIGAFDVFVPAHASLAYDLTWDPILVLGDVTVVAHVTPIGNAIDPNPANDEDAHADFVIVGGLGGVIL